MVVNDKAKTIIKYVSVAALTFGLLLSIHNIEHTNNTIYEKLTCITLILSLLSAIVYCIYGYKKNAASYFKAFITFFALSRLPLIYTRVKMGGRVDRILLEAVVFAMLCILSIAKDLGKSKSILIAINNFLLTSHVTVTNIITNNKLNYLYGSIISTILSLILILMILAKYYDKQERGSK